MKIDSTHRRKTPRDNEYIEAYLRCYSQTKAAEACGVGRTTITRALYRAGIKPSGQHNKDNYGGGSPMKITDKEIIDCATSMSAQEIAHKYNISLERLARRASKLGVKLHYSSNGGHWKERLSLYGDAEYDSSITLSKVIDRFNGICQICGKPVDKNDISNGHIKRLYPTVDHIKSLSKGGAHTWDNIQLAHMACNAGKCDK